MLETTFLMHLNDFQRQNKLKYDDLVFLWKGIK
jgi:hypothetical protein